MKTKNSQHQKSVKKNKNFASYNLDKENLTIENEKEKAHDQTECEESNSGLEIISLTTQTEVQNVVLKLKNGQGAIINLEKMEQQDVVRSLDFLSGAVFALNLSIQKIQNNIYLIQ